MPATADWFSTVAIPVAFDPKAPLPVKWLGFIHDVCEGDAGRMAALAEVAGACLDRRLGPESCAAVDLAQLAGSRANRFAAFGLCGKLANLKGDQGFFEASDESVLKELTGGDPVAFEQKHRQPLFETSRAKIVFGCNQLPTFKDKTEGT
jgi:phage/plasmid-associated DNA primase